MNILTPCPPRKRCRICEARLTAVFGSADKTNKYIHQSSEAGRKAIGLLVSEPDRAVQFAIRAAGFANLALDARA